MKYNMRVILFILTFFLPLIGHAQDKVLLFESFDAEIPYRIPAIVKNLDGSLLAIADHRRGIGDIGSGPIDIHGRFSYDNGLTWSDEEVIIPGGEIGDGFDCAHGDAAVVCDRETGQLMMLAASGEIRYSASTRENPISVGLFFSEDGGHTWSGENATEIFYSLFDDSSLGAIKGMFVGSGKLTQSKYIKVGSNYRVYVPFCCRNNGNRVAYTDDFGKSWHALGDINSYVVKNGDEPKIEELPDGNVLISSRMSSAVQLRGRYFNIFQYTDVEKAEGSWLVAATSTQKQNGVSALSNNTNGEIYVLPVIRKSDGLKMHIALQSIPFGPNRANVGIYYKGLTADDYSSPTNFAQDWEGSYPVSTTTSAYSTMVLQDDGVLGFYWEENVQYNGNIETYDLYYQRLTMEQITEDKYSLDDGGLEPTDIKSVTTKHISEMSYDIIGKAISDNSVGRGILVNKGRKILCK